MTKMIFIDPLLRPLHPSSMFPGRMEKQYQESHLLGDVYVKPAILHDAAKKKKNARNEILYPPAAIA